MTLVILPLRCAMGFVWEFFNVAVRITAMHTMLKTPIIMALSVVGAGLSSSVASNERSDISAMPRFQLQIERELDAFRSLATVDPTTGVEPTVFDVVRMLLKRYEDEAARGSDCVTYPADSVVPPEQPPTDELAQQICS